MGWKVFLPDRYIKPAEQKIHEIAERVGSCGRWAPEWEGWVGALLFLLCLLDTGPLFSSPGG
jgi:hypothetical protein